MNSRGSRLGLLRRHAGDGCDDWRRPKRPRYGTCWRSSYAEITKRACALRFHGHERSRLRNMSLLQRIQDSTLDKDCDVATLLRQCKVFGAQAAAVDLLAWVELELNGYGEGVSLPDYRILRVTSKGHFAGPFGSGLRNADIPLFSIPEEFQEMYRTAGVSQGVGALQATIDNTEPSSSPRMPWPSEAVVAFGGGMYENMTLVQAWKVISIGALKGILDAVKTRVLDFTLELSKLHPELMSATNSDAKIASPQELSQTFHTTIYGSVGAIANASSNVSQHVVVSQGDRAALDTQLAANGVPPDAVAELHEALVQDAAGGHSPQTSGLGPKVKQWLGAGMMKIATGVWSTSLETAGKVLPPLIAGYLGVELK